MKLINRIIKKILYHFHKKTIRKKYSNIDLSIISQNCLGGVIYNAIGKQFKSPTINLFIEDESFVKLCLNPQKYLSEDAKPLTDNYIDEKDSNITYPKIFIDDIEICCLHYASASIAANEWNKRRKRVDFDKLCIIANTWNLHDNRELINSLLHSPYPIKIFTDFECYKENDKFIYLGKKYHKDIRGIVRPDLTDFASLGCAKRYEEYGILDWLNNISKN